MSSPLDFSEFIDPNASTGAGTNSGELNTGNPGGANKGAAWGGVPASSAGSSPWSGQKSTTYTDAFGVGGSATLSGTSITPVSPPVILLYSSLLSAGLGAVLAWILGSSAMTLLGWVFAGPIAIGLIGYYHKVDTLRRATDLYAEPGYLKILYMTTIAVCLVAVVIAAVFVGLWWGRA